MLHMCGTSANSFICNLKDPSRGPIRGALSRDGALLFGDLGLVVAVSDILFDNR